ncbi:MAG TPA: hypothetical protein VHL50_08620, partial [Pyrinomonadaceae bacterium]|nr:hypothetical protein [Pyrinomonadaceae bacterium]
MKASNLLAFFVARKLFHYNPLASENCERVSSKDKIVMPTLILYVWSLAQAIVLLCCFSSCSALAQTVPKKDATRTDRKAWRSALKIPD